MRITYADGGRRAQNRCSRRPKAKLDSAGVGKFPRQRNLIPAESRPAHIDGELAASRAPAGNDSGGRFELQFSADAFAADQGRDAAHTVAASARFRAVIIVDTDRGRDRSVVAARGVERHQLIVGLLPRRRARLGGSDRALRSRTRRTQIDDDDLVAEAVHLDEVPVRQRAHDNARMCGSYMRTRSCCARAMPPAMTAIWATP